MSISVDTLKANLTNPQRTYLWEVIIPNPLGGVADTQTLLLRCQSAVIPSRSFGNIDVPYKQSGGIRYRGKLTYTHEWDLTFIEGEDKKMFDGFYAWCQKIVHDLEGTGDPDTEIKVDMFLNLLDSKQEDTQQIKLVGCYPQAMGEVPVNYADEGVVTLPITMAFDRWEKL